jgi:hypothetical protein
MIRWQHKTGSTPIVEGAAQLILKEDSKKKIIIKSLLDNKLFIVAVKHGNYYDLYSFTQYETNVLPTEVFIKFKEMFPNLQLTRTEKKQ